MTLPPVVRVFFAVELPANAKDELTGFIGQLKKRSKANPIRWSRPENLHVTLQFLAEVRSQHIPELIENVKANIAEAVKHTKMKIGGIILFPNPFRPRVIVLDITPQDELAALSALIGQGIVKSSYAIEDRPFRGHLTIGRIKQPQGVDLRFLSEFKAPEIDEIEIGEVVLYRSEPQSEGSQYTVLERIAI